MLSLAVWVLLAPCPAPHVGVSPIKSSSMSEVLEASQTEGLLYPEQKWKDFMELWMHA